QVREDRLVEVDPEVVPGEPPHPRHYAIVVLVAEGDVEVRGTGPPRSGDVMLHEGAGVEELIDLVVRLPGPLLLHVGVPDVGGLARLRLLPGQLRTAARLEVVARLVVLIDDLAVDHLEEVRHGDLDVPRELVAPVLAPHRVLDAVGGDGTAASGRDLDDAVRRAGAVKRGGGRALDDLDVLDVQPVDVDHAGA